MSFPFFRQANLNEAAEKFYAQAAGLRPNVSEKLLAPIAPHFDGHFAITIWVAFQHH